MGGVRRRRRHRRRWRRRHGRRGGRWLRRRGRLRRRHALLAEGEDRPQRGRVEHAGLRDAEGALERPHRGDRRRRVTPVDRAVVVPAGLQLGLQLADAQIERRRRGAEPGAQRGVGRLVVHAGLGDAEVALQGEEGGGRRLVEHPGDGAVVVAEQLQRLLHLRRDDRPGQQLLVPEGDEVDLVRCRVDELALDDRRGGEARPLDVTGGVDLQAAARADVVDVLADREQLRAVGERRALAAAGRHGLDLGADVGRIVRAGRDPPPARS